MRFFKLLSFFILNSIFIPYRFKILHRLFMDIKASVARGIFQYVGKNVNLRPRLKLTYMHNISIGDNSSIGDQNKIVAADLVKIGNNVMMGPEIMIFTQNHQIPNSKNELLIKSFVVKKPVIIEDDVWIGARAIILPGAIIRKGSVVAAGSVVPGKEYKEYSILGGNPAKLIRRRC